MPYSIDICMPYFQRLAALEETIISFIEHGYFADPGLEVRLSICDDGSISEPVLDTWVEGLIGGDDIHIVSYLPQKDHYLNPCLPLNRAVARGWGDYILIQSPEVRHDTNLLEPMARVLSDNPKAVVLAPVKEAAPRNSAKGWVVHPVHRPKKYWFCQMMRRDLWEAAGGMDERFRNGRGWDDNTLVARLERAGAKWHWLNPDEYWATHTAIPGKKEAMKTSEDKNRALFLELYGDN
ncbi:MAG: glycosyltransferase family 2 protein [Planctomycetota bacterium]|jgi:hypothetical protein